MPDPVALAHVAVEMRDETTAAIERDGADPPRRPLAEIDIGPGPDCGLRQQHPTGRHVLERHARRTDIADTHRAADRSANPQSAQTCSAKRPSAAAAVSPCAVRLRTPCGSNGSRVFFSGSLRLGRISGSVMLRASKTAELASPRS